MGGQKVRSGCARFLDVGFGVVWDAAPLYDSLGAGLAGLFWTWQRAFQRRDWLQAIGKALCFLDDSSLTARLGGLCGGNGRDGHGWCCFRADVLTRWTRNGERERERGPGSAFDWRVEPCAPFETACFEVRNVGCCSPVQWARCGWRAVARRRTQLV